MSIATLILGNSGTGKSTSLRNIDPKRTLLIQCINKPLPFRSADWKRRVQLKDEGSVFVTSSAQMIHRLMSQSPHDVVVIDDFQAMMVDELMSRSAEKGYEKFSDIGKNAWSIFTLAGQLAPHRRVYILAHTQSDDYGQVRMKTVGRMVDEKIVPESYFTIVLRTHVEAGTYSFSTQSNGSDCCKSPMQMFQDMLIPNDLAAVDAVVSEFYGLSQPDAPASNT